ncbi:hypothetical protein GCM10027068_46090 [Prescottella soli]|uniref:hypothetical protein n=1 Tax=Rhodococcus hoagii TaxID=43767 RepID=UPI0019FE60A7|nr:hypothetical protein [Prescottella equi]NKR25149.1 hypothetical protein [Prescottella equi]NKS87372.1 hypothetical protein [Prescottella equi]BCN43443.1 hypothetical protein RE9414_17230 [Prescottella equi]
MADHEVRLSTKNLLIAGIDMDFDVKVDGEVLGTLSVSEGGLDWRPKHYRKKNGWRATWTDFNEWIVNR